MRDGVYERNSCGMAQPAAGREALLQEAYIRLQMEKGSFPYDRELGSLLLRLDEVPEGEQPQLAFSYAQAALAPLPDIHVLQAQIVPVGGVRTAEITLDVYGEQEKVRIRL